ncbi:YlxR family protein [Thermomonospora amylolytica]|nr:YlxR family protein [Thermomonospora amylolytica]
MTRGPAAQGAVPCRTCVGCRVRTAKSDLLRLVVVEGEIVPDPRGRLPGRGASIHPDPGCLELAERRRAFPRAFRVPGPLDVRPLREYLEARAGRHADGQR